MKCLAGIVTYNPNIEILKQNISSIFEQVDNVIVIDNGSKNNPEINEIAKSMYCKMINLPENMGIAYALNLILDYADKNNYDYFLTLDQDSICPKNIIEVYYKYLNLTDWGILTCNYISTDEKATNKNYPNKISEVNECITSGSFCKVSVFKRIGGFDNKLFIDCVDNDICINLRVNGYRIFKVNEIEIKHNLGVYYCRNFFNHKIIIYSEPPFRHYYISRNWVLLSKKYHKNYYGRVIRIWLKSFIFESRKYKITKATFLGIYDGLQGKSGKIRRKI